MKVWRWKVFCKIKNEPSIFQKTDRISSNAYDEHDLVMNCASGWFGNFIEIINFKKMLDRFGVLKNFEFQIGCKQITNWLLVGEKMVLFAKNDLLLRLLSNKNIIRFIYFAGKKNWLLNSF